MRSSLLLLLLAGPALAAPCPPRPSWPTPAWTSRATDVAAQKSNEIKALEDYAFTLTGADSARQGIRTDAVLIVARGEIVYEHYARGWDEKKPHFTWSMTKSLTNALTGLAVGRGVLALSDSICRHLALTQHCDITVQHLLEFSSGLAWKESYEGESNQVSSVLAMLYGEGRRDMATFIASHATRAAPGTTYMYSSGDTTLLAAVVDHALRGSLDANYPWTLLFDPIGVTSARLERDAKGQPVGSSYFYATPRDLARFGLLFGSDGCWEGRRLLPDGWVSDSTAVSAPFRAKPLERDPGDVQGRQFWLNRPVPEQGVTTPWPGVPEDAFAARGHWGQSITIVPSLDVIIVRLGDDRVTGVFDFAKFLNLALAVAR
jgi:CubicO group peptidase (beta-lactamase class C family)